MVDYSILASEEKIARLVKVEGFKKKYGSGKKGLNTAQKNARVEKFLGSQANKVRGFGYNKPVGITFFKSGQENKVLENHKGFFNNIPSNVLDNLDSFPLDNRDSKGVHKILDVEIFGDGTLIVSGIVKDGNESDVASRILYNTEAVSDEEAARGEMSQFRKGVLKEVSDRTMSIHLENGDLDALFVDNVVDTGEDKILQY